MPVVFFFCSRLHLYANQGRKLVPLVCPVLLTVGWKKLFNQFFMQFKTLFHLETRSSLAVLNDSNFLNPPGETLDH